MGNYTLGLDIGSNSIGWTLVDIGEEPRLVDLGVRVFPEEGKGASVSKGGKTVRVSQRGKRGIDRRARNCRARRLQRRKELIRIMTLAGLLPQDSSKREAILKDASVDEKDRPLWAYKLRAEGLERMLTLFEFGRAIMHLAKRRGYQTNRKGGDPTEDKSVGQEAQELLLEIDQSDSGTLGRYLYRAATGEIKDVSGFVEGRIRNRRTFREMYKDEFDRLWEHQREYYRSVLIDELKGEIWNAIFYQRPPRYREPGPCDLDGQPRCLRACWTARQFVLWQKVNNFRIEAPYREPQTLSDVQRAILHGLLSTNAKVKFANLRKELELADGSTFNFEEGGKKKTTSGDEFLCDIRKQVGASVWDAMGEEKQKRLVDLLAQEDDETLITQVLTGDDYQLDAQKAKSLLKVYVPEGRSSLSEDALCKILPQVKDGKRTDEAIRLVYGTGAGAAGAVCDRLARVEAIENHVVMKAMCELREVVNALLNIYGKPKRIKVEMARDLNKSREEKDRISREIKKNTQRNDEVKERLRDLEREYGLRIPPKAASIVKYRLWTETNQTCIYCGRRIHPTKLFGDHSDCEVEHILPRKRSLQPYDYNNKTLCHVACNQLKDNCTPFEAYKDRPEEYRRLLKRVFASDMPKAKKLRFVRETLDLDDSVERNINDTRYVTRRALSYLQTLGADVFGTRGMATDLMRKESSFETLLEPMAIGKKHEDNRNHAVDAVVVALTTPDLLRDIARGYDRTGEFNLARSWAGMRKQLEERLPEVKVSYRPRYRISDYLHKEMAFGLTPEARQAFSEGRMEQLSKHAWISREKLPYIISKDVTDLIKTVGDVQANLPAEAGNIKEAILAEAARKGVDVHDANATIPWDEIDSDHDDELDSAPRKRAKLYLKSKDGRRIPVWKIRVREPHSNMLIVTNQEGEPYKGYVLENNHHIEVAEFTDPQGTRERRGTIVTQLEAARRWADRKPVVRTDYTAEGGQFLYSLARNEMFMVQFEDGTELLHRVEKISGSTIVLRPHTYGGVCKGSDQPPLVLRRGPNTLRGHKVLVDCIGRVRPVPSLAGSDTL